ncbi:MAG: C13 family peptidase [Candidatus Heimdallarchaeaceae archaeon]
MTYILLISTFLSILHLQYTTQSSVLAEADCPPCLINQAPPITESSPEVQSAWILLAGDTEDHKDMASIQSGVNIIYETLRGAGFTSEQLYYMGPEVGPSQPYVNTSATNINLQYAIETWAPQHVNSTQSLGIALLSHGDINALAVMVDDSLRDYQLDSYLDNFETTTGCKRIIVVIEGCHSGSFIDKLSQDNRIIVTSTATHFGAAFNADRTNGAFSESFWSSIAFCATIGKAFEGAVEHIRNLGKNQVPQLDDNHDGVGTTPYPNDYLPTGGEGFDALNVKIWAKPRVCFPKIKIEMVPLPIYEIWDLLTSVVNIDVEVESSTGISKVYARFVPSDWEPFDPLDGYMYPINDAAIKMVELEDPLMNGIYSGDAAFDRLALGDSFMVNILAYDADGMVADIVSTSLSFNADGEAPPDTEPPSIYITRPDSEDVLSDVVEITARGYDNQELENIELYIDGVLVDDLSMPDYYPYPELSYLCDTSLYENGLHNITAVAVDLEGLTNQTSVLVTFDNDISNPLSTTFIGGGAIVLIPLIVLKVNKKKGRKTRIGKGKREKK